MRLLFACFLLALVTNQLFFVNSQIVQLFNDSHLFEIGWEFLAHEKAGSNGVGSDYQPFHYFIGGDGTCSEEVTMNENLVDEQLDKAIDSIEDNLSPTYVGASYSNYNASLSFIFTASFNTAVDLEARKDMLGYELQVINNSGKMSCVKIFIKKKYIDNAKMKRTITIKLKDIILSFRKPGFTFFYGSARMSVLFVKPSGGYFHYKNLTTKLTDVGLKSLEPDVDITEPIDRTLCYGQFANFTCVARTGKSPDFYTVVTYPYSVEFNEIKGLCRRIYDRKHFNFTVNDFDRIDKNIPLYFKLLRTENLDIECGNEFLSPTKDNQCVKRNVTGNEYCDCNGTCHKCYTYIRGGFWSAIEARINKNRSNPCALKPNSAFDFQSLIIEEKFNGNRSLDKPRTPFNRRQLEKKHEQYNFSIDVFPRPCFTQNKTHMIVDMNDVNKHAHSSLYEKQLIELTIYAVTSSQDPYRKDSINSIRSDFIKPDLVEVFKSIDHTDINYSGRYEVPFMEEAYLNKKFIIQVRFEKSKSMKKAKISCTDESNVNNKFNEVDSEYCVKLVGYFQVNEKAKIYDTRTCMTHDSAEFRNILLYLSDWRSHGRLEKLASDFVGFAVVPESFDLKASLQLPLSLVEFYTKDAWSYWFWLALAACILALILLITYVVIRFCKAFPDKQLVIFISPFTDTESQYLLLKIAKVLKCNMCVFKNYHITIINYGNFWENRHYLDDLNTLVVCLNHGLAENQKLLDLDTNTRDESILSLNPLLLTYLSVHKESNRCIDVTVCANKSDRPLTFNNVPNFSLPFEYPSFVENVKLRSNYLASVGKNVLITSLANLVFKISSHVKLGQAKSSLNSRVNAYFKQSRHEVNSDYFDLFLSGEYL